MDEGWRADTIVELSGASLLLRLVWNLKIKSQYELKIEKLGLYWLIEIDTILEGLYDDLK